MPQRTYTGIDLTDYITNFTPGSASNPATPNTPSQGVISLFVSASFGANGFGIACDSDLHAFGNFDFNVFPAIPAGALISEIDFSWDISSVQSSSSDNGPGPGNQSSATCCALITANLGGVSLIDTDQLETDTQAAFGPVNATVNINDSFSNHTIITFDPPISKAELQTLYSSFQMSIAFNTPAFGPGISAFGDSIDTVSGSITGTVSVSNFNLTITYEEGPISGMTITPASGNVEPGQILVVTATDPTDPNTPDFEELTYAATTADGKVIPITPQFIDSDEDGVIDQVWLEAPYPATDPCFDCFPGCPECVEAFAPCDEDLTSDACQEAMQTCLDCLVDCLEDLQLGEECQQSSGSPPDTPVPVIIIASGGTQFSGSVVLGSFTILVANGSGLYRFTIGQTHDILYTADRDGTTYNVKIPNPGGKTGFFRS